MSSQATVSHPISKARQRFIDVLHLLVLVLSIVLLYAVTYDTLHSVSLLTDSRYLRLQFWICNFFIFDILVEWMLRPHRMKRLLPTLGLIALCVPYITFVHHYHWHVTVEVYYLLRIMPVVRAAAVLVVMWGIMEKNWVTGMFGSYIIILTITLYVLSLLFYVEEHAVNPDVYSYWQSLWYSFMQMNTCGSNISPVTTAGKVIGVVLSVEGLIMFPVFTVFFTRAFARTTADGNDGTTDPTSE